MKIIFSAAIAATLGCLSALPVEAAALSALNTETVKFTSNTPESELIDRNTAKISFGNTTIYIGTNQVSANNQDPIVTSFTNGIRDWTQSYDSTPVDGRGVGLLWDEGTESLYGVFTADGGSSGFGAATQGGWLQGYGQGGGPVASVLLKLNPESGAVEAGTYIRATLSSGRTNTVRPTGLDFVNGEVVFLGDSFFVPLDKNGVPFENRDETLGSPFDYRVVLTADLSQATSAEAIGWNGVTAFSPLTTGGETAGAGDSAGSAGGNAGAGGATGGNAGAGGSAGSAGNAGAGGATGSAGGNVDATQDPEEDNDPSTGDNGTPNEDANNGGVIADDVNGGEEAASVPEPGIMIGLWTVLTVGLWQRSRSTASKSA